MEASAPSTSAVLSVVPDPAPPDPVAVDELLDASERNRLRGAYVPGVEQAGQAVAAARAAGDQARLGRGLALQAEHLMRLGRLEEAVRVARQAQAAHQAVGDQQARGAAILVEAFALMDLGLNAESLDSLGQAQQVAARLGDRVLSFWVLNRLGSVYEELGDPGLGRVYLLRALEEVPDGDDELMFCVTNNLAANALSLARVLRRDGDAAAARAALTDGVAHGCRAAELAVAADHTYGLAVALGNVGALHHLAGDGAAARRDLDRALALAVQQDSPALVLEVEQYLAEMLVGEGRDDEALPVLLRVRDQAETQGRRPLMQRALGCLVDVCERTGDLAQALHHHRDLLAAERATRSEHAQARARLLTDQVTLDDLRRESELQRARGRALEQEREVLRQRADELYESAHRDPLTRVGNRRHLDEQLAALCAAGEGTCVLALADVDHFKAVNDTFGHPVGDRVLVRLAQLLAGHSRPEDVVARLGGEEFALVLRGTDPVAAWEVCERMREAVEHEPWHELAPGLRVTVSFGVAAGDDRTDPSALLAAADEQLYRAKHAGRNRVCAAA